MDRDFADFSGREGRKEGESAKQLTRRAHDAALAFGRDAPKADILAL